MRTRPRRRGSPFGLTVVSVVRITGVDLVFSYLIVPAVCGALLSADVRTRLIVGWIVAFVAGVSGLLLSVKLESLDLPRGRRSSAASV